MIKKDHIIFKAISGIITFLIVRALLKSGSDDTFQSFLSIIYTKVDPAYRVVFLTASVIALLLLALLLFRLIQTLITYIWQRIYPDPNTNNKP